MNSSPLTKYSWIFITLNILGLLITLICTPILVLFSELSEIELAIQFFYLCFAPLIFFVNLAVCAFFIIKNIKRKTFIVLVIINIIFFFIFLILIGLNELNRQGTFCKERLDDNVCVTSRSN